MQSTGIPAHYRQLTREQILSRWQGQNRPQCHVELVRLYSRSRRPGLPARPSCIYRNVA